MIDNYVTKAKESRASDIHLAAGHLPLLRIDGALTPCSDVALTVEEAKSVASELSGKDMTTVDDDRVELDLSKEICGVRCRVNLYKQKDGWSAAIRLLSDTIPALEDLGVPPAVLEFPAYRRGLVLVTGETGSGKSTTLAAILDKINKSSQKHILTLEDPIEYVYGQGRCLITQREVGRDTVSFATGLRAALREDPDVILVGEMRDLETIETALTASETGHLVFGTVHTFSAADSVDRLVDVFPPTRQAQIRMQVSMVLKAVLSQQLLPKIGGGRVLACEVMKVDTAMRALIRDGKTHQIPGYIQTGAMNGNILMEKSMQKLLDSGVISQETFDKASGILQQKTDAMKKFEFPQQKSGMDGLTLPSHVKGRR